MEKNFRGVFNDTVYISANPSIDDNELDTFHNVVTLWDSDWDDEEGTVLPDTVVEKSLEIGERYPEKRLVVHFLQPHYPFLGSNIGGSVEELRKDAKGDERHEDVNPWRMVRDGIYDPDEVWNAYVENHRKVIPKAYKLGDELPGKSVLTSDHGNAMGAPLIKSLDLIDIYGHPWGVHLDEIVEVPWVEIDSSQRKPIVEEKPAATSDISGDAKKRLKEIGYLA
ncbi:hypothetical protein SAMN05192561_10232 [Halopenitus malekzadehii]|uniref:Sulfatase n=2 Tax=Halopenitus malekzadehii TaxID=1267564 RepID=A0A1H6IGA4_9EURY|nr:hypothetical protein SAMN05192561_10232 [Halopenitus malekzadehii]